MDEARTRCPWCAVLGLAVFSLFGWYLTTGTGASASRLTGSAESLAARQLAAAGHPWLTLKIDNDIGHLVGDAPSTQARAAAIAAAQGLLKPMIGVPGVFAHLNDDVTVAGVAPPAAMPQPSAAAPMDTTEAMSVAAGDTFSGYVPNAQVLPSASMLTAWAGPTVPAWSHEVYVYPTRSQPITEPPPVAAAACEGGIQSLLSAESIRFATASAQVSAASNALLDRIASAVRDCGAMKLAIEGHTDSRGPAEKNQLLSQARAESVLAALVARGVPAAQLSAIGYGESQPLDPAQTEAAWERNRRIEFRAVTAAEQQ